MSNDLVPPQARHGHHRAMNAAPSPSTVAQTQPPGRGSVYTEDMGVVSYPAWGFHFTPDDIRNKFQASDSYVDKLPRLGQQPGADPELSQRLSTAEQGFATRMGMEKAPAIRVGESSSGKDLPSIGSGFTQEGTPYIQVNQAALKSWTPSQLEAALAFETSRLKHGDGRPEHVVAALNDKSIADRDTFRSDQEAVGPMGTNNPKALRELLEIQERQRLEVLSLHGATDFRDPEHPPIHERLARLPEQQATPRPRTPVASPRQ